MKRKYLIFSLMSIITASCADTQNPFFAEFDTPYGVPPFDKIKTEHYMPAFIEGMRQDSLEIEAIANNPEPPTFANTIEALEYSGAMLDRVRMYSSISIQLILIKIWMKLQRRCRHCFPTTLTISL